MLVDGLEELANDERHGLDALDLLLGAQQFPLQVLLLVLDVLLLHLEELELALQQLEFPVQVRLLRSLRLGAPPVHLHRLCAWVRKAGGQNEAGLGERAESPAAMRRALSTWLKRVVFSMKQHETRAQRDSDSGRLRTQSAVKAERNECGSVESGERKRREKAARESEGRERERATRECSTVRGSLKPIEGARREGDRDDEKATAEKRERERERESAHEDRNREERERERERERREA